MSTQMGSKGLLRQFASGSVPMLVFLGLLALAFLVEPVALFAALGSILALAALTVSRVLWSRTAFPAIVSAAQAATIVAVGIAVDSWAALPLFWCALAASAGIHLALRMTERRGGLAQCLSATAAFAGGMSLGLATLFGGTVVTGLMSIALLGGLVEARRRLGPPAEE